MRVWQTRQPSAGSIGMPMVGAETAIAWGENALK
jgi:hypothetical protein